jgi:hexosaminidase
MFMPRGLAISEIGWSWQRGDFGSFENRVHRHLAFMKSHGIDYGPEDRKIVSYKVDADAQHQTCGLRAAFGMPGLELHYTLDGTTPNASSSTASESITWPAGETLKVAVFRNGGMVQEPTAFNTLRHLALGKKVTFLTPPSPPYAAAGTRGLVDGILGSSDFHDGMWLGWHGVDMEAVVDLGAPQEIGEIALHCLQDMPSWILMPKTVIYETSMDGSAWAPYGEVPNTIKDTDTGQVMDWFASRSVDPVQARYIRVTAKTYGTLPPWHLGAGGQAFIFADELSVR